MIILTIRTDKPVAELGLYEGQDQVHYDTWEAHRQLAETIHRRIETLLSLQSKTIKDVAGIVVFQGPGSFTGLRIGLTVANVLADSLAVPIVGTQGEGWISAGIDRLIASETDGTVLPFYGADVHITAQKK